MSDIQLYLLEVDKNKPAARDIAAQSAAKLADKRLKLIDLVSGLQEYINNTDDAGLRANSLAYLADVLENVSPKVLSGQERRLLCDFILGRIEGDVEGIGASARALIALEERGKWDAATAQKVAQTFLGHAHPLTRFKLQTERFAVVQLFDLLLAKYRTALKQLHDDDPSFTAGFVSFFEGEKDPRNLMIIFSILHVPMTEWDVHAHAQDLFEAVFNYFPITFKPPPDDPYGITAQDLKDRLRDCVAANSDFAPHSVPALLDKLDSTSMNTKRDVLQAIQACVSGYGPATINLYSVTLWDALKFEILNVQEEELAEDSLKALALIAETFADAENPLNSYLRPIIKECNEHLEDAPTKQSQAAGRILHAVASTAVAVAEKVAKGVLPVLFSLYHASESITKRRGLLEVFNEIAKAHVQLLSLHGDRSFEALRASSNDAIEAMLRALVSAPKSEVSFRLTALAGLAQLIEIRGMLTETEIHRVVDAVTEIILHEHIPGHGDIRGETIKTLVQMTHHAPDAIRSRAIPAFMVELPDVPTDDGAYRPVLEAFAQLSSEQQVFDTVVLRLKNKFNAARRQNAPTSYQHMLLLATLYAFTYGSPALQDGVIGGTYFTDYAQPLVDFVQHAPPSEASAAMFEVVGRICNVILRRQGLHFQSSVYNTNLTWLSAAREGGSSSHDLLRRLSPFSLYYYAALRTEVVEPDDILAVLQTQAALALSAPSDSPPSAFTLRHISLLVNKFLRPPAMPVTLSSAGIEVESLLSGPTASPNAVAVAFAVVKALLIQGKCGPLTSQYLHLLLDLLPTADASLPGHFTTLLARDDILTKENHCTVSALHPQKLFAQTVPSLTQAVRTADPQSAKPRHLVALSGILRWLPYDVLQPSLATLLPPLLQTLDLPPATHAPAIKSSTLTIFESALTHDPALLAEHAAALVTRLLNCTSPSTSSSGPGAAVGTGTGAGAGGEPAHVRAASLRCLTLVPRRLRAEVVVPFQRQVVKRLLACLDDRKRAVRAEAVRCRTAWIGVDDGADEGD